MERKTNQTKDKSGAEDRITTVVSSDTTVPALPYKRCTTSVAAVILREKALYSRDDLTPPALLCVWRENGCGKRQVLQTGKKGLLLKTVRRKVKRKIQKSVYLAWLFALH